MSTERDELTDILHDHLGTLRRDCRAAADAILAVGYGKVADAWDEGRDALARSFLKPAVDGFRSVEPNPYRQEADQ